MSSHNFLASQPPWPTRDSMQDLQLNYVKLIYFQKFVGTEREREENSRRMNEWISCVLFLFVF